MRKISSKEPVPDHAATSLLVLGPLVNPYSHSTMERHLVYSSSFGGQERLSSEYSKEKTLFCCQMRDKK